MRNQNIRPGRKGQTDHPFTPEIDPLMTMQIMHSPHHAPTPTFKDHEIVTELGKRQREFPQRRALRPLMGPMEMQNTRRLTFD